MIPQAWQHAWWPGKKPGVHDHSRVIAGLGLFDPRTVAICRTGHGNVHFWLVAAMHAFEHVIDFEHDAAMPYALDEAWRIVHADAKKDGKTINKADATIARLGMQRWIDAGGVLLDLCHAGLYGEI